LVAAIELPLKADALNFFQNAIPVGSNPLTSLEESASFWTTAVISLTHSSTYSTTVFVVTARDAHITARDNAEEDELDEAEDDDDDDDDEGAAAFFGGDRPRFRPL
jgi:hypothetical protein